MRKKDKWDNIDSRKLDPVTLRQIKSERINGRLDDIEAWLTKFQDRLADKIEENEADIQELQEARKVQIRLNEGYKTSIAKLKPQKAFKWPWQ